MGVRQVSRVGYLTCFVAVCVCCFPPPPCGRKELESQRDSAPCPPAIPLHIAQPYRHSRAGDATLWLEGKDHALASTASPATPASAVAIRAYSTSTFEWHKAGPPDV